MNKQVDQFKLCWISHQTNLISRIGDFQDNDNFVDCTLSAEGRSLKAHQMILASCSPYFATILSDHSGKHPVFVFNDVTFEELEALVNFIYHGEVNIDRDKVDSFMKTAQNLQIKGFLQEQKVQFPELSCSKEENSREDLSEGNDFKDKDSSKLWAPEVGIHIEEMANLQTNLPLLPPPSTPLGVLGEPPIKKKRGRKPKSFHIQEASRRFFEALEMESCSAEKRKIVSFVDKAPDDQDKNNKSIKINSSEPLESESGHFSCPECGKSYTKRYNLLRHQKLECGVEPSYSCNMCPMKFVRRNSVQRHFNNIHLGMKPNRKSKVKKEDDVI